MLSGESRSVNVWCSRLCHVFVNGQKNDVTINETNGKSSRQSPLSIFAINRDFRTRKARKILGMPTFHLFHLYINSIGNRIENWILHLQLSSESLSITYFFISLLYLLSSTFGSACSGDFRISPFSASGCYGPVQARAGACFKSEISRLITDAVRRIRKIVTFWGEYLLGGGNFWMEKHFPSDSDVSYLYV